MVYKSKTVLFEYSVTNYSNIEYFSEKIMQFPKYAIIEQIIR
jgi:hypothetical protein